MALLYKVWQLAEQAAQGKEMLVWCLPTVNFNNSGLFWQRTKNRTASQPCPRKFPAQCLSGLPWGRFRVLRDQGVTGSTVHTSRGEGRQGNVCGGGCFHCGKPIFGHTGLWLYWFPNTLQSFCLRHHQNKVQLPRDRNPSGFDPGPASSFSSNSLLTVRSCCVFTETKSIPKGGTSGAGSTAASLGQSQRCWVVLQRPHLAEHSSDQQGKPLLSEQPKILHRGQYKNEILCNHRLGHDMSLCKCQKTSSWESGGKKNR